LQTNFPVLYISVAPELLLLRFPLLGLNFLRAGRGCSYYAGLILLLFALSEHANEDKHLSTAIVLVFERN
jgi:hypothetical protein